MEARISEKGIEIEGKQIDKKIFNEEKVSWDLRERKDFIEHICDWIAQSTSPTEKKMMLEDLKYLINLEDEFIFSSVDTNEFIAKSDNEKKFNKICEEILKWNSNV